MTAKKTGYGIALSSGLMLLSACSVRGLAIDSLAGVLSSGADTFASEEDPELARDAMPFVLKAIEAVLAEDPEQEDMLLAACTSFTQYSYAFVQTDATLLEFEDYKASLALEDRALKLYLRARDYGLRALELRHRGCSEGLIAAPADAVAAFEVDDVPIIYWTAAAWGLAISVGLDRPEIVADVDAVRALLRRALELDEDYDDGVIHEAMLVIESFPEVMGGSPERARLHFERALELSGGNKAAPYVTFAESVAVPSQNQAQFESLLETALAVDPNAMPASRLSNILAQRRARHLLNNTDEFFLEPLD
jgi:predicted anti-sigma-YlaC factor YlaD